MPSPIRTRIAVLAALLAVSVLGACGDDDATGAATTVPEATAPSGPTTPDDGATFPVTVTGTNGPVEIAARPERIVSLSAIATETLFAIDAGEQVVAVDDYSTYPEEAPRTDLSGYTPNVEAVVGYDPDLVVLTDDIDDVIAGLEAAGLPVLQLDAARSLDESWSQMEVLGAATGHVAEAAALVADLRRQVDELVAKVPERSEPLTYFHELDPLLYTATSSTFIGQVYALVGLENVADPADTADSGGYPQLSAEFVIDADPDLIFLADTRCCGQDASTVAARPGWGDLQAVREGRVVLLDDDVASRWGPRIVDFLRTVVDATSAVPVA